MPLSAPAAPREPIHLRDIIVRGYRRDDGLFDIEAHLLDAKSFEFKVAGEPRPPGTPVHSMWLRITIDKSLTILDAEAASDAMPYVGECDKITPDYKKLIGVKIRPGYTQRVKELFGGVRGCTHITELASVVATAAYQTLAGQGIQQSQDQKPFQLDGCHALASTSPTVARFYPKWYTGDSVVEPATAIDRM